MITSLLPLDWQDLQQHVGRILEECGFDVEIEKKVKTVRGDVEIDVFAQENVDGRLYTIICECKYWKAKIPQTIIHGFRTVCADIGVHQGYIISTNGFQDGAYSASVLTNVDLVTWEEFQNRFSQTWLENYLSPTLTDGMDELVGLTEPLVQTWMGKIPDEEIIIVKALREKYEDLGFLATIFASYSVFRKSKGFPKIPLRTGLLDYFISRDTCVRRNSRCKWISRASQSSFISW